MNYKNHYDGFLESRPCPVCGTEHNGAMAEDECPVCDWIISGLEEDGDDVYDEVNHMTLRQAKENYAKGLNIWGEPLK